jgi:hypothetical protein
VVEAEFVLFYAGPDFLGRKEEWVRKYFSLRFRNYFFSDVKKLEGGLEDFVGVKQ